MERNIRDVLEEEVVYDHSQFGLLNNQADDGDLLSVSPQSVGQPPRKRLSSKWSKLSRTAALCGAYVSLGLCFSVTGPTLLYLKDQVGATIPEISYIFTLRSAGTLGGAFLGGFSLDRCNPYSAFFVIIAMMAISIGAMPWCKHLWMLMVSSVIIGVGNGMLDTGASTLCLQLWGKDSGPYMQALHFAYAVGGSIAPLLVEAFIIEVTAPANATYYSSRHVRSATPPLNSSSELDDYVTATLASHILNAIDQHPDEMLGNGFLNRSTDILPSSNISTTAFPLQNLTTLSTAKPKPKPAVINGQAFGDSKQFDNIPLKIDPLPPTPLTTATAATTNETTTTTTRSVETTTASNTANTSTTTQRNETQLAGTSIQPKVNLPSESDMSRTNETAVLTTTAAPSTLFALDSTTISKHDTVTTTTATLTANATLNKVVSVENTTKTVTPAGKLPDSITDSTAKTTISPVSTTAATPSTPFVNLNKSMELVKPASDPELITTATPPSATTKLSSIDPVPKSRGKSRGQQIDATSTTSVPSHPASGDFDDASITTNATAGGNESDQHIPTTRVTDYLERFGVTRMHMLYTVIAIIVLHTAFAFLFFLCSGSRNAAAVTSERHTADRKIKPFRPASKLTFVGLMFSFYLMYVGSEVIFAQFLTTFALESPLKLPTSTANYITTTFWVSFAAGRFVAIFVAHFANPTVMLVFNMASTAIGSLALCISGETDVRILYVGSALVGIGMASTFATGFVWTETHLLVTNRISAVFSIGSSMGEMIFPTITGSFMELHPMSLMYLVLGLTVACVVVFSAAWFLAKRKENGKIRFSFRGNGYHLARQADDETTRHVPTSHD